MPLNSGLIMPPPPAARSVQRASADLSPPEVGAERSAPVGAGTGSAIRWPTFAEPSPPQLRTAPLVVPAPRSRVVTVSRTALIVVAAVAIGLSAQLTVVSSFEHRADQQGAFNRLRLELAEGTAPLGQTTKSGRPLPMGTPMAVLEIPSIGVHQVVLEGTTSAVLMSGPGLARSTAMPGDTGTTVILGREATFGGPFSRLHDLRVGQKFTVVTGEGTSKFQVLAVIGRGGAKAPAAPASGKSQLILVTADGTPFFPSGVLHVYAKLIGPTLAGSASSRPASSLQASAISHSELIMAGDPGTLWTLVFWLQALVLLAVAATWSWNRWGHRQTWVVFVPPLLLMSFFLANQFAKLLPNLL